MARNVDISEICDEILLHVLDLLKIDDILRMSCVCKRFNRLAHDQSLHRTVHFGNSGENLFLSPRMLQSYLTKHAGWIQSLILIDCYWITACKIGNYLKFCRSLRELDVVGCELSLPILAVLAERNLHLTALGWSIPCKLNESDLCGQNGVPTLLNIQLCNLFRRLSSLKLRCRELDQFKTIINLFPRDMRLAEFALEYNGLKPTSIIHDGSGCNIHVKSNIPFSTFYDGRLQTHHNISLYFNVILMDFATKMTLNAAKTGELTALIAPGSFNVVTMDQIASSFKTPLLSAVNLSCTYLTAEWINWLGSLTNLKCLNLQHVKNFKANLMKAVATNCPNLISLNLNNCDEWVDEDLCALETLSSSCLKLQHLNIGKICFHLCASQNGKRLCEIVGKIKHLRSLSIAPCCLVKPVCEDGMNDSMTGPSMLADKPKSEKGIMEVTLDEPSLCSSSGYITRHAAQKKRFQVKMIQNGSGIDDLVQDLKEIENLELTGVGYSSVFSIPFDMNASSFICPVTRNLLDVSFLPLRNWRNLKMLTLAGLRGLGSFNSLIEITKSCSKLEQLSLANIGLPGNAMALASLPQALCHCQQLKKLRVDQPHFNRIQEVFTSLTNCSRLESIFIACKNGEIPKQFNLYMELFEACKRLCVFQLFSVAPGIFCRMISRELIKRYIKKRPPLSVKILHYTQSLTEDGLQGIPFSHLKNLTCFESKIAIETVNSQFYE